MDGMSGRRLYHRPALPLRLIAWGTFRYRHLKYKLDDPVFGLIEKICCFYKTQDGTLWLGSNGYGIYKRMQNEDGKEQFVCYNSFMACQTTVSAVSWKMIKDVSG